MRKIICNQNGHGQVPSGKDLLKIGLGILTFPITLPILLIKEKLKKRKEKK
jgi:hypothetical protein